jgi:hypothetical protein
MSRRDADAERAVLEHVRKVLQGHQLVENTRPHVLGHYWALVVRRTHPLFKNKEVLARVNNKSGAIEFFFTDWREPLTEYQRRYNFTPDHECGIVLLHAVDLSDPVSLTKKGLWDAMRAVVRARVPKSINGKPYREWNG